MVFTPAIAFYPGHQYLTFMTFRVTGLVLLAALVGMFLLYPPEARAANPAQTAQEVAALKQKIAELEERLLDLQSAIGTFQSMATTGISSPQPATQPASPAASGDLAGRVEILETQTQALLSQMQQVTTSLSAIEARLAGTQAPANQTPADRATAAPDSAARQQAAVRAASPEVRAAYNRGHRYIEAQDYGRAATALQEFLQRYPDEPLAANAQYWLGESYYLQGQYKKSARAFLTEIKKYKGGSNPSESYLRLGMSLARLGESKAACTTFAEIPKRFPAAPDHVRRQTGIERNRIGC